MTSEVRQCSVYFWWRVKCY